MHSASAVTAVTPMRTGPYNARQKAVQQRLYGEGPELPPRLVHRGHLSWLNTYTTQLQAEGKSVNTQKSYMIGLRHLIETPLPGEDILSEFERDSMSCLLYTSPSPRDGLLSRMPSSA